MLRAPRFPAVALALAVSGYSLTASAQNAVPVPSFLEETRSGIDSVYEGEWEYMVGGGAASFDCNADGFPDLFLAGGSAKARFYINGSARGGALQFKPHVSGLELDKVTGAYPLDIDGDAVTDLVLLRVGENVVMRGLGGCAFERANERWAFDGGDAWSAALAATWERGSNWPTIAIGNYINRAEEFNPWGSCTDNWLHRPSESGSDFASPLPLKPSFCALSMLFTDWNRSGMPALRISNDREYYKGGQEQLWHVEPGKPPVLFTEKEGWAPLRIWGMGIAAYDLNFDGYPEYFLTSMADNKLQTLKALPKDGRALPAYSDIAFAKGVTAHRPYTGGEIKPSTAWHAQFEDVNNDGLADLYVAKGNVAKMPDFAMKDPDNLLLQQADGKFVEVGDKAGIGSFATGRGATLADFNLDGLIDLVVVNRWDEAQIWRNTTPKAGRWVQLRLSQSGPNRDGIGAWIEVKCGANTLRREITVGGGHASGHLGWWHFGLGSHDTVEIRVIWPDGQTDDWQKLPAGNFYTLERGKPALLWTQK